MRLVILATVLTISPLTSHPNQNINNSVLKNSPIFDGNNNTFNQTTNIVKQPLPKDTLNSINRSAAALEATSSSLIDLIDYFSEKNSETARNTGNPRLSAEIEKQRIRSLETSNPSKENLVVALIRLADIESSYDVPSAIKTLDRATAILPNHSDAAIKQIQLLLKYQYFAKAENSLANLRRNWNSLTANQRHATLIYEIIYLDATEQSHLIEEKAKAIIQEFDNQTEQGKQQFIEDTNVAISIAIKTQYLRNQSTEGFSKVLNKLVKDYYHISTEDKPVVMLGFGNFGIQLDNNKTISAKEITRPKNRSEVTSNDSIFNSTLDASRKLLAHTNKIELDVNNFDFSQVGLNTKRLAIRKTTSLLELFPECIECPIAQRAEIVQLLFQNIIHLASDEAPAAYSLALEIRSKTKALASQFGSTPISKKFDAISLEALGKARIKMSEETAGHSFIPENAALDLAIKRLDEIEAQTGINLNLKLAKARFLKYSVDHYRSTGHIGLSWVYCESLLNTIEIPLTLEPLVGEVSSQFIECQSSRLARLASTTSKPPDIQLKEFQKEAIILFEFLEKNKIELTEYGKSWIQTMKRRLEEINNPKDEPPSKVREDQKNNRHSES